MKSLLVHYKMLLAGEEEQRQEPLIIHLLRCDVFGRSRPPCDVTFAALKAVFRLALSLSLTLSLSSFLTFSPRQTPTDHSLSQTRRSDSELPFLWEKRVAAY